MNNLINHLRGVVFDMDGVLCDSEPIIADAACRMFELRHGVQAKPEDFRPFVGTGEDRYLGGVAEKYGARITLPEDKDLTYALYLEMIKGRLRPLPGVHAFVAACRARGLKLAVATSADVVKMDGNLREIKLPHDSFDVCVSGDQVRRKKPDPEIFLFAARRLGLSPTDILVVEDAPNGIKAARAAGCQCLGLLSGFDETTLRQAGANFIARDLAEALTAFGL